MAVHVVIDIMVLNRDMYEQYIRKVPPIVNKFGGRYVARGSKITSLAGNWHPERVIILEFDSARQVNEWFTSAEYAEIAPLRENSTITRAIVIESGALPDR